VRHPERIKASNRTSKTFCLVTHYGHHYSYLVDVLIRTPNAEQLGDQDAQ